MSYSNEGVEKIRRSKPRPEEYQKVQGKPKSRKIRAEKKRKFEQHAVY